MVLVCIACMQEDSQLGSGRVMQRVCIHDEYRHASWEQLSILARQLGSRQEQAGPQRARQDGRIERLGREAPTDLKSAPGTTRDPSGRTRAGREARNSRQTAGRAAGGGGAAVAPRGWRQRSAPAHAVNDRQRRHNRYVQAAKGGGEDECMMRMHAQRLPDGHAKRNRELQGGLGVRVVFPRSGST